jgi:hypothetical protein
METGHRDARKVYSNVETHCILASIPLKVFSAERTIESAFRCREI